MYNRREPLNPRLTANECKMKTKKKNLKTKQNQKTKIKNIQTKKNNQKKKTKLKTKQHYLKHEIIPKSMQVSSIRKCSKTKTRPQDHETS